MIIKDPQPIMISTLSHVEKYGEVLVCVLITCTLINISSLALGEKCFLFAMAKVFSDFVMFL